MPSRPQKPTADDAACRVCLIVEVPLIVDPRPVWWRAVDGPPPTIWTIMFEEFTGADTADEWGLAAAIFIARVRHRTGHGPTFSELFAELDPDSRGVPSPLPSRTYLERRRLIGDFRLSVAIEWKRRGWISWDPHVTRSLRVGRVFRERSRQRQTAEVTTDHSTPAATSAAVSKEASNRTSGLSV